MLQKIMLALAFASVGLPLVAADAAAPGSPVGRRRIADATLNAPRRPGISDDDRFYNNAVAIGCLNEGNIFERRAAAQYLLASPDNAWKADAVLVWTVQELCHEFLPGNLADGSVPRRLEF